MDNAASPCMDRMPDDGRAQKQDRESQHDSRPITIEQTAARQAERGSDQGRPKVDGGVGYAVDVEVGDERLGDQSEALGSAWKRRDHGQGGHREVGPAVIDRLFAHKIAAWWRELQLARRLQPGVCGHRLKPMLQAKARATFQPSLAFTCDDLEITAHPLEHRRPYQHFIDPAHRPVPESPRRK